MSNCALDVYKDPSAPIEKRHRAYAVATQTVRMTDDPGLRRELASISPPTIALGHLESLFKDKENEKDAELKLMQINAYIRTGNTKAVKRVGFEMIGFDPSSKQFKPELGSIKNEPLVYKRLSDIVSSRDDDPELAAQIIEKMVEENPESGEAYLYKSNFLRSQLEFEKSSDALDKAYELDPADVNILYKKAQVSLFAPSFPTKKRELLQAIQRLEKVAAEIKSGVARTSNYRTAKNEFLASIAGLERSKPTFNEAKQTFLETNKTFESEISNLVISLESPLKNAKKSGREAFEEAQAEFEAANKGLLVDMPDPLAAKELAAQGIKEHPDTVFFYRLMAQILKRLGERDQALAILNEGISKDFDVRQEMELTFNKIELLLDQKEHAAVEKEIKRLSDLRLPELRPLLDLQKALVSYSKKEWAKTAKQLKRIRPLLFNFPQQQIQASTMLGDCYEKQGMTDLAEQIYQTVLDNDKNHAFASQGLERVRRLRGRGQGEGVELEDIVNRTLELPEAEQDWARVSALVTDICEKLGKTEAERLIMEAKISIKRRQWDDAKQLIRDASRADEEDINVQIAAILLFLADPSEGPGRAIKLLDRLEKKWGRSLRSLQLRADILTKLRPEDVGTQLRALITEADNLTGDEAINDSQRLRFQQIIGLKFEQLGMTNDAREFYELVAKALPDNVTLRTTMFDMALRERNDEAMEKALGMILETVGDKSDPSYVLPNVRRKLTQVANGNLKREDLVELREQLDQALEQRPTWHELHITYGQLLLMLGGKENSKLAIEYFDKALEFGRARSAAVVVQVKVLAELGIYDQALQRMYLLNRSTRNQLLGTTHANILLRNNKLESAYDAAKALAEEQPKNAEVQDWFSRIAQQNKKYEEATKALRLALDAKPVNRGGWIRLMGLMIEDKQTQEIESVLRKAHLSCQPEDLPLITAKYHEMRSRWQNAEDIYLASFGEDLDSTLAARQMAEFYLLWSKKDQQNVGKAAVYINRILKAANQGKLEANNAHLSWARRKAAEIMLSANEYAKSIKAEKLLRDSAINNRMNTEEQSLLVNILINRNDPKSLLSAKELLQGLNREKRLTAKGAIQLASILNRTDEWDEAKTLLRDQITQNKEDTNLRVTYIKLLIEHAEFKQADRSIDLLQKVNSKHPSIVSLRAQLASEQGDQARLTAILKSLLPKNLSKMNAADLKKLFLVAQLAEQHEEYDMAGKLYKIAADRDPSKILNFARFQAYHGDCEAAVKMLKRLLNDQMDEVISIASRMLILRREEIGDQFDSDIDRMLRQALADDPDSIRRQITRAEAYQTQDKFEESIARYEQLLDRDDLSTRWRAVILNNLGFLLGLLNQRVDEAEQMVNQAIETFGPNEDMLDTRAVVRIAQKKYDMAIKDMELALSVSRDPVKYFHLAKACALSGDGQAALQAWEKAKKNGFELQSLPNQEQVDFEKIRQKIESFETQSAKL